MMRSVCGCFCSHCESSVVTMVGTTLLAWCTVQAGARYVDLGVAVCGICCGWLWFSSRTLFNLVLLTNCVHGASSNHSFAWHI
jgi:hypothetical protein